jgi:hypothetical protein
MTGNIKRFILIRNEYADEFTNACSKVIESYQSEGLYTEIQFSSVYDNAFHRKLYTAMIIGRESD